jgi:Na+/H+-dicarboxylate symporter
MGRIGGKTVVLYLFTTASAITLALLAALITKPGSGFALTSEAQFAAKDAPSLADTLIGFIPMNPIKAMAEGNMIQIIIISLLFGLSLSLAREHGRRVLSLFSDLNEGVMKMVVLVMMIAPIGVFCLIAEVFARQGFAAILPLSKYFFTVLAVLIIHLVFVYAGILKFLGKLSPAVFFRKFKNVMIFAFSTSSSNATLPVNLETVEHRLGVDNSVASFTLPLGATINMDGTAIMQGVATVFIAQAYGLELTLMNLLMVVFTATLASIGTAGVPGVGLIMLAIVLRQVNLPVEGIGLIIGVDRLLDMTRTAVNVTGDAIVTCVVAKSEGQLHEATFLAEASK